MVYNSKISYTKVNYCILYQKYVMALSENYELYCY